jgi:hypothetical protein
MLDESYVKEKTEGPYRDERGQYYLVPVPYVGGKAIGENEPVPSGPDGYCHGVAWKYERQYVAGTATPENLEVVMAQRAARVQQAKYAELQGAVIDYFNARKKLRKLVKGYLV